MERITITLPEQMKAYVEEQVKSGSYGNTSEFIRDLIRHQQQERESNELEALLLEGMKGESEELTHELIESVWTEASEQSAKMKRNK